ncbi:MAG TPA: RNA methyltransferase [Thermosynechococcaceae cyanobacterium]
MLTSLQNPLVKQMRKLHRSKERRQQQLFLLEGTHLIEAASIADRPFKTLCHTLEWQAQHPHLWQQATQRSARVEVVSLEVLRSICTTVEPDGVVATMERWTSPTPIFTSLGLVLETVQDPGNLGTMIRTAAAAGAEGLLLSADSVDLDNPKVLRSSVGQWFQLPMATSSNLIHEIQRYRSQGMQVIATLPSATQTYWETDLRKPTLVLLGNEGGGLSAEVAALADRQVTIPLSAGVESLNVAIAAALILYEAKRQRADGST